MIHSAIEQFFAHSVRRTYPAKATIISAGDHSSALYYIAEGSVSVVIDDDDGHEIVLAYLNEGDFFGEMGLFDERRERSAWVRARTKSEIAQIDYSRLSEVSRSTPEVLFAILCQLSIRVRDTTRKVGDLAFKDVSGRIARSLLDLCEQPDALPHELGTQIRVTRQELGRIVGCSREMASRVLRDLEERHVIEILGKDVVVFGTSRTPE